MVVTQAGDVGIGVTDPDAKLEVNGHLHLSGNGHLHVQYAGFTIANEGNTTRRLEFLFNSDETMLKGFGASGQDNQLSLWAGTTRGLLIKSNGRLNAPNNGSAANPIYSFTSDPNTGMYRAGTDLMGFVANGQNAMYVDGTSGTGRVGIALNAPTVALDVNGSLRLRQTNANETAALLEMGNRNGSWAYGLTFNTYYDGAWKRREADETGYFQFNSAGSFLFATGSSGSAGSAAANVERLRIHTTGFVEAAVGGGNIIGRYSYGQRNTGTNAEHKIRGPNGGYLLDEMGNDMYARITVVVTGTSTSQPFCLFEYYTNSDENAYTLTHLRGNSGSSSNRPYMGLNGKYPWWKMNHSSNYLCAITVEIHGGQGGTHWTGDNNYTSA